MQQITYILVLFLYIGCAKPSNKLSDEKLLTVIFKTIEEKSLNIYPPENNREKNLLFCAGILNVYKYISNIEKEEQKKEIDFSILPSDLHLKRKINFIEEFVNLETNKFLDFSIKGQCALVIHKVEKTSETTFNVGYAVFSSPSAYSGYEMEINKNKKGYLISNFKETSHF